MAGPGLLAFPKGYFDRLCAGDMGLKDWLLEASGLEIQGVEMYPAFYRDRSMAAVESIHEFAAEKGLQVPMMCTSPDFTQAGEKERKAEVDKMQFWIDAMSRAPVKGRLRTCRVLSGQRRPDVSREDGVRWVVECIGELLPFAERRGVHLVMENHYKDGLWEYPEFAQHLDVYTEIVESIRSEWFGVNYDPSNALIAGEDPIAVLDRFRDRILTMHASDRHLRRGYTMEDLEKHVGRGYPQALEHGVIGTGLIDYGRIFAVLKDIGFSGWISIEDGAGGLEDLRQSVSFLNSMIRSTFG